MNTAPALKTDIPAILASFGLSASFEFVPVSQSRNAKGNWKSAKEAPLQKWQPTLNWRVTVTHKGREILTTDYGAGCAHAPSYPKVKWPPRTLHDEECAKVLLDECETGRTRVDGQTIRGFVNAPSLTDLFYSLVMDSDVIESSGFEDWASNLGYDTDSRAAESIYRACLEIALKLRAAIGDADLQSLREAFQDY